MNPTISPTANNPIPILTPSATPLLAATAGTDGAATDGAPQWGHNAARLEICCPQSGQLCNRSLMGCRSFGEFCGNSGRSQLQNRSVTPDSPGRFRQARNEGGVKRAEGRNDRDPSTSLRVTI